MKKILSTIIFLTIVVLSAAAEDALPEYIISSVGVDAQPTYLVEVSVVVKKTKKDVDENVLVRRAHGILFKDFSSKENRQSQLHINVFQHPPK